MNPTDLQEDECLPDPKPSPEQEITLTPDPPSASRKGGKRNRYSIEFKVQVAAYANETSNSAAGRQFTVDESLVRRWREQKPRLEAMLLDGEPKKRLRLPRGTYTGKGPGAIERVAGLVGHTSEYERVPLTQFCEEQSGVLTSLLTVNPALCQLNNEEEVPRPATSENGFSQDGERKGHLLSPYSAQASYNRDIHSPLKSYSEQEMESSPTLADLVRCSKLITTDLSLLASAVDVPDQDMEALKQQFSSTTAQALQLLKVWQRTIGGNRHDLYELIQLLSDVETASNGVST